MIWALVENEKIEATPKINGTCPIFAGKVFSKCGEVNVWHWVHYKGESCDHWHEPETWWHFHWKMTFGKENTEVVIKKDGQRHIADIFTNNNSNKNLTNMKKSAGLLFCVFIGLAGIFHSCAKDDKDDFLGTSGTFKDTRDGTKYTWVKIGNQIWMADNLAYLPSVSPPSEGSQITPFYYVYGYQGTSVSEAKVTSNYQTYGVLYNWPAAMISCPTGWHLPSDAEWTELTDYLGGTSVAGGKLKEPGTTNWTSPNTGATNETGFTALPGGYRYGNGAFYEVGSSGVWWSATEGSATNAWYRTMYLKNSHVYRNSFNKEVGFSVRCLRD